MKKIVVVLVFGVLCLPALAQGRKDFKEAGIKSATVYKYEYKTGKEVKTLDEKNTYDINGNLTEMIEYDDFGKVTKHEKYTYDQNNDELSKTIYDAAGKVKKVLKSTYNAEKRKVTESEYDAAGKLKKISKYSYFGKFKTEKLTYDANNKLIQKKVYIYEK